MKKKKLQYGYNMETNKYKTEKSSKYGNKQIHNWKKHIWRDVETLQVCAEIQKNLKTQNMRHAFKTDLQM